MTGRVIYIIISKMNFLDKKMDKLDICKVEIGARFKVFRELIDRTTGQLAADLDISESEIEAIEAGRVFPKISCLHYFYEHYGLNINWLIGNIGTMFVKNDSGKLGVLHAARFPAGPGDPRLNEYAELLELMEIPVIKDTIMATLLEIKTLLKKEIGDRNEENSEPGSISDERPVDKE